MKQFVYSFANARNLSKDLLGGKGFGLVQMTSLGLPVPPGFIITTEASNEYYSNGQVLSEEMKNQIIDSVHDLEFSTGKKLYGPSINNCEPLFLSARSGAKISMPGMMDTILNIGATLKSCEFISEKTKNTKFSEDILIRFFQMFCDVYAGISKESLMECFETSDPIDLKVEKIKKFYKLKTSNDFPESPYDQLFLAIESIFKSWNNERAVYYRKIHNIPEDLGTAVTIQSMVFGNYGSNSGTGVAFSRNPVTGEKRLFGEYLVNAQGEDVVAGIRTPSPIENLKSKMPKIYQEFSNISSKLENHFNDMQDMEFTIENGKLYILQTRSAKRSANAAVKVALDLVSEKKISEEESLNRISESQIQSLLHSKFKQESVKNAKIISKGLPASPGAAVGKVVFSSKKAAECKSEGEKVILVRQETSAEDIEGMTCSEGILTVHGGMTSHAAVVARGMGRCCVSGCENIIVNEDHFTCENVRVNEGDYISIDGSTGLVYLGKIDLESFKFSNDAVKFLSIAKKFSKIQVMANADNPESVTTAISLGAQGVGLCRTEHMFFEKNRINFMREMIISQTKEERKVALDKLFNFQKNDFYKMFLTAKDKKVTIRLLDPPLHEFLPKTDDEISALANDLKTSKQTIKAISNELKEFNPMMGHRGCRLLISYPEIAEMQTCAIISASIEASKTMGMKITPDIMIPLVGDLEEIKFLKKIICNVANKLICDNDYELDYKLGTMIEVPRAAFIADKIAKEVDFFSFGTNDLTQMTFGFSRDDSQKFLRNYYKFGIYKYDPFTTIDIAGVGELIKMAISLGKSSNPNLIIGVCGEHAGDSKSIQFFKTLDIDYVSCSPLRVPGAILASAKENQN